MTEISSRNFPEVYEDLGIDTGNLGCIMIDTVPIAISDVIPEDALYYSDEHEYVKGNVSENVPHMTLLYGLLNSGPAMKKHVERVLEWPVINDGLTTPADPPAWFPPKVYIDEVSFFYGADSDFVTIIALVQVNPGLLEGHQRLSLLPHINTFGEYKPHITLAYVKASSDWESYVRKLNEKYTGTGVPTVGINLGD